MVRLLRLAAVLSLAAAAPATAQLQAPPLTPAEARAWRQDLRSLAEQVVAQHPRPFHLTPRAAFDSAVAALDARIPSLRRHQVIVGMMEIVALVRDAHTSLNPAFETSIGFHTFPVEFYAFDDGLYVVRAAPAYAGLAGAKVLKLGRLTADEAMTAVARVVSHENEQWVKARGPFLLAVPEVLHALGIIDDLNALPLGIEQDGGSRAVTVRDPRPIPAGDGHGATGGREDWADMRRSPEPPLYLQQPDRLHWFRWLPDSRTLYVAFRAVVPSGHEPLSAFYDRVFAAADSLRPDRLVLDVRQNGGGNNFFNRALVLAVIRHTRLDQPGRFFAIIGRETFSAAQNLVNELEWYTNVTFVGEPTGNSPNQYGDGRPVTLPNSGLRVSVSTLHWQTRNPSDPRPWVPPAIATPLTGADYRAGVDPAMRAILRRSTEPPVAATLAGLIERGDTAGAERLLRAAIQNPENRWRDFEPEVNTLGYTLLRSHRVAEAVAVFAINTRVYPGSANVWDSYGEGLEQAGRREAAIAAFRKALEINPHYGSSRAGLARLGAAER